MIENFYFSSEIIGSTISDNVLNDLVRRVLDEVSEHDINDSAHL